MGRFMEMVEEFKTLPPQHEIARASILLPGDKGYPKPKVDPQRAKQAVKQDIADAGPEPEWMRMRRLKAEQQRKGGPRG